MSSEPPSNLEHEPSSSSPLVPPLPPYGFHGLGSTASLVGILKAAALNPFENLDDPDIWSPNSDSQPLHNGSDDESDEYSEETMEAEILTLTHPINKPSVIRGSSVLRYPNKHHVNDLARELIGEQTRCAEQALRHRRSTSTPTSALPHSGSTKPSSTVGTTIDPTASDVPLSPKSPLSANASSLGLSNKDQSVEDTEANLTPEDRLCLLEEEFGKWTGLDAHGRPESETWIDQLPGVLYRSVVVKGAIALTNRRLCYLAYLPILDKGTLIRSGTGTYNSSGRFSKSRRRWIELRTDSVTDYRSSTSLFKPVSSLHLSDIKHILPISAAEPKTISFRLMDNHVISIEFDTMESAALWHQDFVGALFGLKTKHSHQIKLSLPLRRVRKLYRETFENIAKMMTFELDFDTPDQVCSDGPQVLSVRVIENSPDDADCKRLKLAYLLSYDPFDETIVHAVVRAKMELTVNQDKPQSSKANFTPLPMFEVLDPSDSVSQDAQTEEKDDSLGSKDHHIASDELAKAFTKAFGLEAHEKLYSFWRPVVVIGQDLKLRIPLVDIGLVREATAFGFTRFGLAIELAGASDIRLDFSSKSARNETLDVLNRAVSNARVAGARALHRHSSLPVHNPLGQAPVHYQEIKFSPSKFKVCPPIIGGIQLESGLRPYRILCMTIGSRGDVQPYISLAQRLMRDGHIVTIASHPEYRTWVESFGILYKDVGGDPGALMKLSVEHAFFSPGFFKEGLGRFRKWLDDLFMEAWVACQEAETEILIESPSTFSGIHIAEALQIPYFRAFTMTWTSTSTYPHGFASGVDLGPSYNLLSYSLFDHLIWRAMAGQVNRWRKHTLGIPPTTFEKMQPYKVPFMYNFSAAVVPKPLDWRDNICLTGYWFLDHSHGDYQPPSELTSFIASARAGGHPLIYIGFGSVTVPDATAVTKAIYGAVTKSGVRAIVAKGWSERVQGNVTEGAPIEVPAEVYVLESVPHDWLFPQMDAVCHHGGAGTCGISLRFGVPTLIHPFFGDQMFWADRVTRLGAGMRVDSLTVSCLTEAFGKATKDRVMKEKAGQVGERIRAEDGPSAAVAFIYRHLDFALERTMHRIQRTAPKRPKTSLADKSLSSAIQENVSPTEPETKPFGLLERLTESPVEEDNVNDQPSPPPPPQDLVTKDDAIAAVPATERIKTKTLRKASLNKIKELVLSARFLLRISSSATTASRAHVAGQNAKA